MPKPFFHWCQFCTLLHIFSIGYSELNILNLVLGEMEILGSDAKCAILTFGKVMEFCNRPCALLDPKRYALCVPDKRKYL